MLVPFVGAREAQCPPLKDPGTLAHELSVSSERRKAPFPSPSPECPWAQGVASIPMADVGEVVLCPRSGAVTLRNRSRLPSAPPSQLTTRDA